MEYSGAWRRSNDRAADLSPHRNCSPAKYSYMLLCELLKMDLYNHNDPDHLSVMDMIDDKTELDLFVNSDRPDCGLDPKLEAASVLNDLDAMDTGVSGGDGFGEFEWLNGLQSAAISQLQQLSETENTDPNLLVNPQTAIPIHLQQPTHTTQIRDAMLTDNLNSHNINVILSTPTTTLTALTLPSSVITTHGLTVSSPSKSLLSPSESSPVLVEHLQNGIRPRPHITVSLPPQPGQTLNVTTPMKKDVPEKPAEKVFPKPVYSYSCLIALALKNSQTGSLPVSEIYSFMTENFPYFKTAPDGWKNSVRHNLSLNKCFEKVENPKLSSTAKKGCLWALNPAKKEKMEEEIAKGSKKDPAALRCSMAFPERLEKIERGEAGLHHEKSHPPPSPSPCRPAELPSTPQTPKTIKTDDHFTSDLHDLQVLDSNFALDTSLSDLAMQHGLWDDDLTADLTSDLNPHVTMATVGSPLVTTVSTGEDSLFGGTYHGTCLYTSSPIAGLQTNPASLTATLLSLAPPSQNMQAALI